MCKMEDPVSSKDPILAALRIPCQNRTKKDLQPIIEFVRGLKFFHSFSQYPHTVEEIAMQLNLHSYRVGDIVFSEGDPGELFYIILDGEVTISKRKKLHSLIDFVTENVVLVKLGCGKYFGETALESQEGLRTASAVVTKPANLLALDRSSYQTILMELKLLLRGAVRRTLMAPSSIFNHIRGDVIERLSELVVIRTFGLHEEIYSAGKKVNSLMVVKTGLVKLVKPVLRKEVEEGFAKMESKFAAPDVKEFGSSRSRPITPASPGLGKTTPTTLSISSPVAQSPRTNRPTPPSSAPTSRRPAVSDSFHSPVGFRPGSVTLFGTKKPSMTDTPTGYWILTRSEDFIDQTRSQRHAEAARSYLRPSPSELIDFTIAVLMPGQVFGEISLLDPEQSTPISAIAATAVELYCFDSELLVHLNIHRDEVIMRCLRDDWKFRNPPHREIIKQLQERYSWERRKGQILHHMKVPK